MCHCSRPLSRLLHAAALGAVKFALTLFRSARAFFHDMFDWEWLPRVFDPRRVLATPRALRNQIGPDPRVVEDSIWAKLVWAGLNITEDDISKDEAVKAISCGGSYPLKVSAQFPAPCRRTMFAARP